tara:strand:- start:867 stop:1889 length:1023 start_codon:yes stop_codon:yes gene_type:complete
MTVAKSQIRTLIPFAGGNWDSLLDNEIFTAVINNPPVLWGCNYLKFAFFDMTEAETDLEHNEARAGGTRLKMNDLEQGWDVSQRPLIVVLHLGDFYLWDGFNRWTKLDELGETIAPVWIYELKTGFNYQEVKEHVQLSANNHARSDEATRRDFINTGIRWAQRNKVDDVNEVIKWINISEHQFKTKDVSKIASSIILESETTNVRHIPTGNAAKSEAYRLLDRKFSYTNVDTTNPLVMCTKESDYIKDIFMMHMQKFVKDDTKETTELVGYTKGCESEKQVLDQRQDAKDLFDKLDKLVCDYAVEKMRNNGVTPYKWIGFLPQLVGKETGDGIPEKLVEG